MAAKDRFVDRISNLPDVLLLHIFYFLPSHDLLRTSYLSTRFRYLWRSVPVLDVRENHYSNRCSLAKLMNYFLKVHEDLAIIRRFRLLCLNSLYEESDVYKWIDLPTTASCSSLEELYIHLHSSCRHNLSRTNIFSCRKLETIRLYGGIMIREIPIDVHVFFPCLKTVRLRAISIVGGSTLNKLLSGCPRLEIFDTRDCFLLSNNRRVFQPEVNVKKIYIEYHIRLNEDDGDSNCVLSMATASIDVKCNWGLTLDLLKPIFNRVKQLEICNPRIDSWKKNRDDKAAVWGNLTHLAVLKDNEHNWRGYRALSFFLKRSPNLISLVLEKKPPYQGDITTYALPRRVSCYKLETVKITGFDGRLEMENALWFLKNALVLKKLILCGQNISEEMKTRIMDEPRASTDCQIQFYAL